MQGDVPTVSGMTLRESYEVARITDDEVIRPLAAPHHATGGLAILFGNLAPRGAVVKESAVLPEMMRHRGPALVFDTEAAAMSAVEAGTVQPGCVVVIRYVGPKGGPGMPEMVSPT